MNVVRTWMNGNARGYEFDTGNVAYVMANGNVRYQAKNGSRALTPEKGDGRKACPAMDAAIAAFKGA